MAGTRPISDVPTIFADLGEKTFGGPYREYYTDSLASTVGISYEQADALVAEFLGDPSVVGVDPKAVPSLADLTKPAVVSAPNVPEGTSPNVAEPAPEPAPEPEPEPAPEPEPEVTP